MASIAKRADGRWRARYRDETGREHSRHFRRKIDAQAWIDGVTSAVVTGTYVDPSASRVTFGSWAGGWLDTQSHLKASTRVRYAGLLRTHLLPQWELVPLADIRHAEVAAWVAGLTAKGLAPGTVRQAHRVLALVLSLAVRDGRLPRNPAVGVRLPTAISREQRFLSHADLQRLADAAGDDALVIRTLGLCGLRYGELAALRVSRLDLQRRRINVIEAVTEVNGAAVWGTPKTHHRRSVPIPRSLANDLATHVTGRDPDDFVFTAPKGGHLGLRGWRRRVFDPAVVTTGLGNLTPHDLRHTAASLAISAGANVKAVQRLLGHASAAMTLDTYSSLFEDDLDEVAERLDAAAQASADYLRTKRSETTIGSGAPEEINDV